MDEVEKPKQKAIIRLLHFLFWAMKDLNLL